MTSIPIQAGAPAPAEIPDQITDLHQNPYHELEVVTTCSGYSILLRLWSLVLEHWFILGVGVSIGIAAAVPDFGKNNGWIHAEYTVKWGAIIIIFFLTGLTLKTRVLLDASKRLSIHFLIQFISLVLTPAIGFGVAKLLSLSSINADLIQGLIITMSMPTTISSNVVFTKLAGGNEAVAVVNAVIGNLIGIFVSPAWLYLYLGQGGKAPYGIVIRGMALTVIAPLAVGQIVQIFVPRSAQGIAWIQTFLNFGVVSNVMILLLVWATFSNTFAEHIIIDGGSVAAVFFIELGLYLAFNIMCLSTFLFKPCRTIFSLDRADAIAVANCASTKTLALGLPIMSALFGSNPNAGVLALPLIMYNAMQVLVGSGIVVPMRAWNARGNFGHSDGHLPAETISGSEASSDIPRLCDAPRLCAAAVDTPKAIGVAQSHGVGFECLDRLQQTHLAGQNQTEGRVLDDGRRDETHGGI